MNETNKENLTIVIPTLNEAQGIGKVIDELKQLGYNNILVVDGGSTDGTQQIAKEKGATVIQQWGKGKSDAVKTAIHHVETPYVLVMDGDGTYDPIYIDEMLKAAKYHDEVIGARLNGRENIPLLHRFGNKAITFVFNILFGTKLKDVCSGMYLLKTDVAKEVNYESKGFNIEVELAAHVASTTRKIAEVPVNYRSRIGKAKLRTWHGVSIVMEAIKLAWRYNPAFFIFMLGALILIPSLAIAAWVAWEWLINGIKHHIWGIIAITGTGVGIISTLLAIMALFIKRIEYRITEKLKQITNKQNA